MEHELPVLFKELGFTENETKVYLSLLDLGQTTIGPISAKAHVQPTKAYLALDKLVDHGLVSYINKANAKHYQTSNPENVLGIIQDREEKAKALMPLLKQKQKTTGFHRDAEVYDGKASVRTLFDTLIAPMTSEDFYYSFALKNQYLESESESESKSAQLFFKQRHQEMSLKGIDVRLIVHEDIKESFMKVFSDVPGIKICFVKVDLPLGLSIAKGRVINTLWHGRPTSVEIRSHSLAEQYKKFFLDIWDVHCESQFECKIEKQ